MTIKAFITDVDGTIVSHSGLFSPVVSSALHSLQNNNIAVLVNTARAFHRVQEDLPLHYFSAPTITNLGSEIRDKQGNLLYIEFFEKGSIAALVDVVRAVKPKSLIAYTNGSLAPVIYSSSPQALETYAQRYGKLGSRQYTLLDDYFRSLDASRLSAIIFRDSEQNPLGHMSAAANAFEISEIDSTTHMFTKWGINKQSSIIKAAEMLSITNHKEEIISAGDSLIDDKMFEITTGIAVGEVDLPHAVHRVTDSEALGRFLKERFI